MVCLGLVSTFESGARSGSQVLPGAGAGAGPAAAAVTALIVVARRRPADRDVE